MPTRILIRLFLLAGLAAPLYAFALGVGQIEVRSSLNQTFEAEIPLITSNPVELIGLVAQIPRQQDFDQAGIERLGFLSKLRFAVQTPPGGPNVIKVRSIDPVREPSFNLLIELVWPRGRLIREFAVQLDPELYANRRPPSLPPPPVVALPPVAVAPPVVTPAAAPVLPPAPPVSFEGASFYGPVKPGETLAAIVRKVPSSPTLSAPQMMAILLAGNPEAFVNGNPNTLRANAVLKVPTPQALGAPTAASAPVIAAVSVPAPPPIAEVPAPPPIAEAPPPPIPPVTVQPISPPSATVAVAPPVIPPTPETGSTPPQPLSPVEQPQEIIPQASIPQPTPTPTATSTPTEAAAPPTASAPPEATPPPVVSRPPVAAPPPPVVESEISWMDNPVVWIAIGLIVLAVGAVLMLPLLRRPARPQPAAESESAFTREPVSRVEAPMSRTQSGEPQPRADSPPALRKVEANSKATQPVTRFLSKDGDAAKPAAATPPKPIGELIKDMDSESDSDDTVIAGGKGAPLPAIKTPQFEAEPPTASITRRPSPFTPPSPSATPPKPTAPAPSPMEELPSELRMEGLDFDFGDFGIEKTVRPQEDLPPLELSSLKPAEPIPAPSAIPSLAKPGMPDMKFEFTDITQEYGHSDADEPLRLDAELPGLGDDDTMKMGKMDLAPGGRMGTSSDYVETKLDLATAYMDMGDQMGARNLLNEVMQDGDAAQKQRAGELLKKLG